MHQAHLRNNPLYIVHCTQMNALFEILTILWCLCGGAQRELCKRLCYDQLFMDPSACLDRLVGEEKVVFVLFWQKEAILSRCLGRLKATELYTVLLSPHTSNPKHPHWGWDIGVERYKETKYASCSFAPAAAAFALCCCCSQCASSTAAAWAAAAGLYRLEDKDWSLSWTILS